ncbi:MAG: cytidine deaminase [Chloroflexi bacterium]|nr:cytidine deaminase [Chloroflexota bacterium]
MKISQTSLPASTRIDELIQRAQAVLGAFPLAVADLTAGSVGAALLTRQGNIYTGICIDVTCGIGFCAEHAAVAEMLKARETAIEIIVAVGEGVILPPCGRCRELLAQVDASNLGTQVILPGKRILPLRELLPEHWLIVE